MTLINVFANPENIIKIYEQIKNYAILVIHLLKEDKRSSLVRLYTKYNQFPNFYFIKIAISLDLIVIKIY